MERKVSLKGFVKVKSPAQNKSKNVNSNRKAKCPLFKSTYSPNVILSQLPGISNRKFTEGKFHYKHYNMTSVVDYNVIKDMSRPIPCWESLEIPLQVFTDSARKLASCAMSAIDNQLTAEYIQEGIPQEAWSFTPDLRETVTKKLPAASKEAEKELFQSTEERFRNIQEKMRRINDELFGCREILEKKGGFFDDDSEIDALAEHVVRHFASQRNHYYCYRNSDEADSAVTHLCDKHQMFILRDLFGQMFSSSNRAVRRRIDHFYYGPGAAKVGRDYVTVFSAHDRADKMRYWFSKSSRYLPIERYVSADLAGKIRDELALRSYAQNDPWLCINSPLEYLNAYIPFVTSEYTQVPKDSKKNRSIVIASPLSRLAQQSLSDVIRDVTKQYLGMDWSTQAEQNRSNAFHASMDTRLCTIDFSDASDSIAFGLVVFLFSHPNCREFLRKLVYARNGCCRMKDGTILILHAFGGMGENSTFPLETNIFHFMKAMLFEIDTSLTSYYEEKWRGEYSLINYWGKEVTIEEIIANKGYQFSGSSNYNNVFTSKNHPLHYVISNLKATMNVGDDTVLIGGVSKVLTFGDVLDRYGFKVNTAKSFYGKYEFFRESCGSDFIKGWFCRGFYLKTLKPTLRDFIRLVNFWVGLYNLPIGIVKETPLWRFVSSKIDLQPLMCERQVWLELQLSRVGEQAIACNRLRADLLHLPSSYILTQEHCLPAWRFRSVTLKKTINRQKVVDYDLFLLDTVEKRCDRSELNKYEAPYKMSLDYLDAVPTTAYFDERCVSFADRFELLTEDYLNNFLMEDISR